MSHNPDWMLRHRCDRLARDKVALEERIERLIRERTELVEDLERAERQRDDAIDELIAVRNELEGMSSRMGGGI